MWQMQQHRCFCVSFVSVCVLVTIINNNITYIKYIAFYKDTHKEISPVMPVSEKEALRPVTEMWP